MTDGSSIGSEGTMHPSVWIQTPDQEGPGWMRFSAPSRVVRVHELSHVGAALDEIDAATQAGLYAAGFITYEAAPAFDAALQVHPAGPLPLLWFGLFEQAEECGAPQGTTDTFPLDWSSSIDREAYRKAIARIKDYIAAGDTYQVNYTFRLRAAFDGDPFHLFTLLLQSQPNGYAAYIDTGEDVVCSISPELFFSRSGNQLTCRPMKGTVRRGVDTREDQRRARWLERSEKNRAENLMIVDMIRNDLGRVAQPGSVQVPNLFSVERYRTLFQLTSSVTATATASLRDTFAALFPCASITGAPKVRTMQIIRELETGPRGIYTGCIGLVRPNGDACFNVAIRTVHLQRSSGTATYGTGGGIVWDSDADEEYRECAVKALILSEPPPTLSLLETLRWDPDAGYHLLQRHLRRMTYSAAYFDIPADAYATQTALENAALDLSTPHKVRLLVDQEGLPTIEVHPLDTAAFQDQPDPKDEPWRCALASTPVHSRDRFLHHKTTQRDAYEQARAGFPGCDDVLLFNERNELTEATVCNLVLRFGDDWVTPPTTCGLLAGTYRAELLELGRLMERVVLKSELDSADEMYLINSVRGWIPAVVAGA